MRISLAITVSLCLLAPATHAQEVCDVVKGAAIIAQDSEDTYLGKISSSYDSESIFNEYGKYGSEYSTNSIWNEYGKFGSEYNTYSPHNSYSSSPPRIVKNRKVIGYLTSNKSIRSSISPNLLKGLCEDYY